jgi:glycosyltransferase involved in cell wall biosynthesis
MNQTAHPAPDASLVTVAITCFNARETVGAAIECARAQDWPNLEIVVVDDASTDGSAAIIERLAATDARIRLIRHPENRGYPAALNSIVAAARGEFIAVFDDDDVSVPSRVTRQWARLTEYEAASGARLVVCYSNRAVETADGVRAEPVRAIGRKAPEPRGTDVADFLLWHYEDPRHAWGQFGSCTLFARRGTLIDAGPFDEAFRRGAEWDLAVRLALMDGHFIAVNDELVRQRKTATPDKAGRVALDNTLRLRRKHRDYLRRRRLYRASIAIAHSRFHYARGDGLRSNLYLALACACSPTVLRNELRKRRRATPPGAATMAKNAGFLFALRGVQMLLRLAMMYFVVRALTEVQFGQYQFILSCMALLTISSLPGLNNSIMQSVARGFPGTYRKAVPRALLASLAGSAVLLGLAAAYRFRGAAELPSGLALAAAFFPLAYGLEQWKSLRSGAEDFAGIFRLEGTGVVVLAIVMIAAVLRWPGAVIVPLAALLGVQAGLNLTLTRMALARIPRDAPFEPGAVAYGIRMTVYSAFNILANQVDKILIYAFLSPAALAIFVAAERLPELTKNAVQDVSTVLAPRFAKRSAYTRELDAGLRKAGMLTGVLVVAIAFTVLPWLIRLVFGQSYDDAVPYGQALMCSIAIGNVSTLRYRYVASKLHHVGPRTINIVMSAARIVASLILVPLFGMLGAVISAFVYRIVMTITVDIVVRRQYLETRTPPQ